MKSPAIKTAAKVRPAIYAYTTGDVPKLSGWTKIGHTERAPAKRVAELTWDLLIIDEAHEGEDEELAELDAQKVLSISQKIRAREIVR